MSPNLHCDRSRGSVGLDLSSRCASQEQRVFRRARQSYSKTDIESCEVICADDIAGLTTAARQAQARAIGLFLTMGGHLVWRAICAAGRTTDATRRAVVDCRNTRQLANSADPKRRKVLVMKIDGGCHCGQIAYEAEIDVEKVLICHCTDCQTLSGSAFRTVAFAREGTFKLLAGELKIYIKTSERGTQRAQSFCPECGTPIYSGSVGEGPKVYVIRVGTARQRNELVPKEQHWFRSAQPWVTNLGSVRSVETQPPFPQIRQGEMSRE